MEKTIETKKIVHDPRYIIEVRNLKQYFPIKAGLMQKVVGHVKAVDDVSFRIERGKTMGLVGESGSGKTTVGKTMLRLNEATSGQVLFDGVDVFSLNRAGIRALRPKMQMIFQDPYSSLSPRMPISEIIGEAVREHNIVPPAQFEDHLDHVMLQCGLQPYHKDRYPHEFSGGQRQRICIARSLALKPDFVVCDEPVSALDVSIQAQIINLLEELQVNNNIAFLFISHDLSVVQHISDYVGVMYLGDLVEYADKKSLFANPLHPYTVALLSAVPVPDPNFKMNRIILEGSIPSPANPPKGCKFHTRCPHVMEICKTEVPQTREVEPGHVVVCHLFDHEGHVVEEGSENAI
jgi:peptide/nickel transport system ATP-binding protein